MVEVPLVSTGFSPDWTQTLSSNLPLPAWEVTAGLGRWVPAQQAPGRVPPSTVLLLI